MFQTGYKGVQAFPAKLPFNGGICMFWYIPREDISGWPAVDYDTQYLLQEPTLYGGKAWMGPMIVPNNKLGYKEDLKSDGGGIFWEQKVSGFHPGDTPVNHVNIENMGHTQFVIVAKKRAGGFFIVIGVNTNALDFVTTDDSDAGAGGTAGNQFAFTGQSLWKAPVLTTFLGQNVLPPTTGVPGGPGTTPDNGNDTEIIYFNDVTEVTIPWNAARLARFGVFPLIEVWYNDTTAGKGIHIASVPIMVDNQPPNAQNIYVKVGGGAGFIVIK